jgi:hypothetical protein
MVSGDDSRINKDSLMDRSAIRASLEEASVSEADLSDEVAKDFSFHMTDWLEDLRRYVAFCDGPHTHSAEQINQMLLAFLQHAPNHIAAAAKLYADFPISDIFKVGAVRD